MRVIMICFSPNITHTILGENNSTICEYDMLNGGLNILLYAWIKHWIWFKWTTKQTHWILKQLQIQTFCVMNTHDSSETPKYLVSGQYQLIPCYIHITSGCQCPEHAIENTQITSQTFYLSTEHTKKTTLQMELNTTPINICYDVIK